MWDLRKSTAGGPHSTTNASATRKTSKENTGAGPRKEVGLILYRRVGNNFAGDVSDPLLFPPWDLRNCCFRIFGW